MEPQPHRGAALSAPADIERSVDQLSPIAHDGQAEVLARRIERLDADAVVLDADLDLRTDTPRWRVDTQQPHPGVARLRVLLDIGQRLAHHVQHVNLLIGSQLDAKQRIAELHVDAGARPKVSDGLGQR